MIHPPSLSVLHTISSSVFSLLCCSDFSKSNCSKTMSQTPTWSAHCLWRTNKLNTEHLFCLASTQSNQPLSPLELQVTVPVVEIDSTLVMYNSNCWIVDESLLIIIQWHTDAMWYNNSHRGNVSVLFCFILFICYTKLLFHLHVDIVTGVFLEGL